MEIEMDGYILAMRRLLELTVRPSFPFIHLFLLAVTHYLA